MIIRTTAITYNRFPMFFIFKVKKLFETILLNQKLSDVFYALRITPKMIAITAITSRM